MLIAVMLIMDSQLKTVGSLIIGGLEKRSHFTNNPVVRVIA